MPGMDSGLLLDELPLWALFALSVAFIALCWDAGFRLGRRTPAGAEGEERFGGEMVGALLGLLAFLLALTFDMAASRYGDRQDLAREQVEAIRMAWLGAAYAEPTERDELRTLLRGYAALARTPLRDEGEVAAMRVRGDSVLADLAQVGERVGRGPSVTDVHAQVVAGIQQVVTLHHRRIALGLRSRTPSSVIMALFFVMGVAMLVIGLGAGRAATRRYASVLAFAVSFGAIIVLISALDRPRNRLVAENQALFAELLAWMDAHAPAGAGNASAHPSDRPVAAPAAP
jgi:hypothetical protein